MKKSVLFNRTLKFIGYWFRQSIWNFNATNLLQRRTWL